MQRLELLIEAFLLMAAPLVGEDVTFERLLGEMVDLRRLSTWPGEPYTTHQSSSYDRASTRPGTESWFANGDAGHFIRVEKRDGREEFVLLDAEGPGVVVRMWSAKPSGIMRIYIDGSNEPEVEVLMEDLLSGKVEHIGEPFGGIRARGYNLYFPIPYAKHCKITTDVGGYHYHVNYRTYEKGTTVESFKRTLLDDGSREIRQVAIGLSQENLARHPQRAQSAVLRVGAGVGSLIVGRNGPGTGAIEWLDFAVQADQLAEVLRKVVLRIEFDGEETVSCPLGDFFGIAGRMEGYASLAMGVAPLSDTEIRLWSRWFMPAEKSISVRLDNMGRSDCTIRAGYRFAEHDWSPRSMHFHAGWHLTKDIPSRPFTDWTHLECAGRGRYVGGVLHLINYHRGWWGEGDEKIYVDGETFPSHFGTGSEDYYGYAWCDPTPFVHAYHGQVLCDGPGTYGNTVLNRAHIMDDIPFTKSFRLDMENWHHMPDTKTTRAAVSYWYARPGGTDTFAPLTKDNVEYVPVPDYVPYREPGVIEGESLAVIDMTAGETRIMDRGESYSGEKELWWLGGRPDDTLTLGFDAPADGRYHVIARLSKGHDFGIVSVSVNGRQVIDRRDMFEPLWFARMPEEDLGVFALTRGENQLTIEVAGKHEKAQDHYSFGIDYLKLKPE